MAVVGFVPHPDRPQAVELAEASGRWLSGAGHEARIVTPPGMTGGGALGARGSAPAGAGHEAPTLIDDDLVKDLDLAVSLGGDGTMLRTVDLVARFGVPVLGVNVGHLGYLSGVGPTDLEGALARFLAGDYQLQDRMTLDVVISTGGRQGPMIMALNDVVLQRTVAGHTVRVAVLLSGVPFLTYAADSLIVATPTGSTAYNLSARGPIVSPGLRAIVLTPVAPHMLFDRALVLGADEELDLRVFDGRPAELVVDGRSVGVLGGGDEVRCRAGQHDARLVSFGERDFHQILKQKFGLTDR